MNILYGSILNGILTSSDWTSGRLSAGVDHQRAHIDQGLATVAYEGGHYRAALTYQ